ncbi:mitochondrial ribonuclease P protein 1 homolog [Contarinia nasturtii]|uniref:mitochondrial ribonuclease P protein 1 homolog n=1 Tax=Contarinia nasturtii TaxID=265458 RepID=UPI0012D42902|nr:mitochondrial ribonuclease P protein 1 homolog [Contarinia nasturtii]
MLRTMLLSTRIQVSSKWNVIHAVSSQLRFYYKNPYEVQQWISTLDEAQQQRIRFFQNEVELKRDQGESVPTIEQLTIENYQHLMNSSHNQRIKYYNYLNKRETSIAVTFKKDNIRKKLHEEKISMGVFDEKKPEGDQKHIEYGLGKISLIPKIYDRAIDRWRNMRTLWREHLGAPKLIYDCSYSHYMTRRENQEAANQLALAFGNNRRHLQPYALNFCGMDKQSMLWSLLLKKIPTITTKPLPLRIHEADASEVFPKEKLVILTPNSPNLLREYNNDDYYVISGIVDRGDQKPLSIAKAKELNIRHARLPLEQYRRCRMNKALTLDQMMSIMLELKRTRDWNKAFDFAAGRKFY